MNSLSKHSNKRKARSRTRNLSKLSTQETLLEIAEKAFIDSNFKITTFRIAQNARVAHGTIFFHFRNREELVLQVVRRMVLRITDMLFEAYRNASDLREFLATHLQAVRTHWPLWKALFAGFSEFNDLTKQEVISLLAVINYYLIEAFNHVSDNSFVRTMLWQAILVYLSFLGDDMFDQKKISERFIQTLLEFICGTSITIEDGMAKDKILAKKLCISCGMILGSKEKDINTGYCKYCGRDDGSLRSFDEVLEIMTEFLQKTQILNPEAAHQAAFTIIAKNPAWKDYVKRYY